MDTTATELQREIHKGTNSKRSYEEEFWECFEQGMQKYPESKILVINVYRKKERALQNIVRQLFRASRYVGTPQYDHTLYLVRVADRKVVHVWSIPDNATCIWLPLRENDVPEDQLELIQTIKSFQSGALDCEADKLNQKIVEFNKTGMMGKNLFAKK